MLKQNTATFAYGTFLSFGLALFTVAAGHAADKSDFDFGRDNSLYFLETGGEMIGEDEDYIIFECKPKREAEHQGTKYTENSAIIFTLGISNKELNASTKGQDPADERYPGYNHYPTQRSDLYLTIGNEKNRTQHPIDDFLALPVNSLSYAPDINYDRDYVWTATFKTSDSFFQEEQRSRTTLKSVLAELKKPDSYF